jgi:uncharacterized membrane protein YdbT with pleckstrin-like domain
MTEERSVYRGNPSVLIHFGALFFSLLLLIGMIAGMIWGWDRIQASNARFIIMALLIVPVAVIFWQWIQVKFLFYEITNERIKITRGLLSKRTEELELYRVKDATLVEPFLMRMFNRGNIEIIAADPSSPNLVLEGIQDARPLREELRKFIEECRDRKRTRITEME